MRSGCSGVTKPDASFGLELRCASARLFVYQHSLLPVAGSLVSTMYAACPTAWALPPVEKLLYRSRDPPRAGLYLFGIFNPTNKLVSGDRRQALPKINNSLCSSQSIGQVVGYFMYKTA